MKRDLNEPILQISEAEFDPPATLGSVCLTALISQLPSDQKADVQKKLIIYKLALKMAGGGVVDLDANEIVLLKDRIGEGFGSVVVGRAWDLLES